MAEINEDTARWTSQELELVAENYLREAMNAVSDPYLGNAQALASVSQAATALAAYKRSQWLLQVPNRVVGK